MAELEVHTTQKDGAEVLYIDGYINAHTVQDFEKSIQNVLDEQGFRILINCKKLEYINSSGLGVLMGVIEEIQEHNGFLYLSDMNETVFNIFDTLGFTHLFKVFDAEVEALNYMKKEPTADEE